MRSPKYIGWLLLAGLPLIQGSVVPDTVSAGTADPMDQSRRHVETIASDRHSFRLDMGGTMDGTNTRSPIGYDAWTQKFEPMRFVKLENVGNIDVINPWVLANGKRRWRTAHSIVEEILRSYGDPEKMSEAEKARAIWEYQRQHRFHAYTGDMEAHDPVKLYNVYGYSLSGNEATVLMDLWRLAGLKVRRGFPTGTAVGEVGYDGSWHLFDSDEHIFCLRRDNETIAGEAEVVADHDLMKRTHTYGITREHRRDVDEFSASLYTYEGERRGEFGSYLGHSMNFTLRPGEGIEWRWGHVEKHHYLAQHLRDGWGQNAWARLCNGKWTYSPPLRRRAAQEGILRAVNVRWAEDADAPAVAPARVGEMATLTWKIEAPYVIVGGALRGKVRRGAGDYVGFSLSLDGKTYTPIRPAALAGESFQVSLDEFFPNQGTACYRYFVRAEFLAASCSSDVGLDELTIENDLQMATLSLPALELGENVISYTDETEEPHLVRLTYDWVERSLSRAPVAPPGSSFPADGAEVEGTQFAFQWQPAVDPDGDPIVDYRFQLGAEPSLRWALSPNFDRLVSKGEPQFTIPYVGLLNPGQRYYWRVRARDRHGVWSPWSTTWSFVPQGPGVPKNVRVESAEGSSLTLRWDANPKGRVPVRFEIYGCNERGFTASAEPYLVNVGGQEGKDWFTGITLKPFPPNLGQTVTAVSVPLSSPLAYYRVVAVDEYGNRSGASDCASSPRPWINSEPVTRAKAGREYRYAVHTISSAGDLRCREDDRTPYNYKFWDGEQPRVTLIHGPAWLRMDPVTGILTGTPPATEVGQHWIVIKVTVDGVGEATQSFLLTVIDE